MRFRVFGSSRIPGTPLRVGASFPVTTGRARPRRVQGQQRRLPYYSVRLPQHLGKLAVLSITLTVGAMFWLPLLALAFPLGLMMTYAVIHYAVTVWRVRRMNRGTR